MVSYGLSPFNMSACALSCCRTFGIRRLAIAGRYLRKMDSSNNVIRLTVGLILFALKFGKASAFSPGGDTCETESKILMRITISTGD